RYSLEVAPREEDARSGRQAGEDAPHSSRMAERVLRNRRRVAIDRQRRNPSRDAKDPRQIPPHPVDECVLGKLSTFRIARPADEDRERDATDRSPFGKDRRRPKTPEHARVFTRGNQKAETAQWMGDVGARAFEAHDRERRRLELRESPA